MSYNFILTGAAGYIAPRHFQAIRDTGNRLVAALDPHDSVGILDSYFDDVRFFKEFERLDRHAEKIRRGKKEDRIHYVSICTPNYLHDAHVRFALRIGAHAICEKPLVLNPWNLDPLIEMERETGKRIFTILQLREHPTILKLKSEINNQSPGKKHEIDLAYITSRGHWYRTSWKGQPEQSGGLASNIGIHFFDMLQWIFGPVEMSEVHYNSPERIGGFFELQKAKVRWFLSIKKSDLPKTKVPGKSTFRSISLDGREIEFSDGFQNLHTQVYSGILQGRGYGPKDARASIDLTHSIRNAPTTGLNHNSHPFMVRSLKSNPQQEVVHA